jgi:hypothetical protein
MIRFYLFIFISIHLLYFFISSATIFRDNLLLHFHLIYLFYIILISLHLLYLLLYTHLTYFFTFIHLICFTISIYSSLILFQFCYLAIWFFRLLRHHIITICIYIILLVRWNSLDVAIKIGYFGVPIRCWCAIVSIDIASPPLNHFCGFFCYNIVIAWRISERTIKIISWRTICIIFSKIIVVLAA